MIPDLMERAINANTAALKEISHRVYRLENQAPKDPTVCGKCGGPADMKDNFCGECGNQLRLTCYYCCRPLAREEKNP